MTEYTYRFIIYSRKSRKAQDDRVQHTHETAEWEISQYLKSLDMQGVKYEIVDRVEEDFSGYGYYKKRPLFSQIVERCKKDRTLTLLSSKPDRIARDSWSGSELLKTINIKIATMPDAEDLMLQILFSVSEKEVKNTSDRFKAMYKAKKERCKELGIKCEWGGNSDKWREKFTKNREAGLHNTTKNFQPSANKQKTIVAIKQAIGYASPKSWTELAPKLNEQGVLTVSSKEWTPSSLGMFCKRNNISL